MIPIRLELQNFLAYRSPAPVVLDGVHLACLIGANGAGKSSLLDAVTWALWGKARTNRDNDLIHLGAKDMHVQLDFIHEGQTYRVLRRREKRGMKGTGRLDLFIFSDEGELNEIREGGTNATQQRINELLRLDYETFVNSAFLQQGQADAFTVQTPARRKQILSTILGLEAWGQYEKRAKEQRDEFAGQMNALDYRIDEIDGELSEEPARRQALADAEAAHAEANQTLDAAEELLNQVADAPAKLDAAKDKRDQQQKRRNEYARDLDDTRKDIERSAEQIADYEAIIAERADIEAGYQTLQDAREASEELSRRLNALRSVDERIAEQQRAIASEKASLESEQRSLQARVKELTQQASTTHSDELNAAQEAVAALEAKAAERDTAQNQLAAMREEYAELRANNDTLRQSMNELKERIDALKQVEGATCPLCGQSLTEAHRAQMLAEREAEGKKQGDTYRANVSRMEAMQTERETLESQIKELNDTVADLPRLQKRAGELQAQVEAATDARNQLEGVQSRLDEVAALLNSGSYAPQARAALAELEAEKAAVGYDESAHDEHRETLKQYREYEQKYNRLSVADESLPALKTAQEGRRERERRLTEEIEKLDAELMGSDAAIAELTVLVETYRQRDAEVKRLRTAEREAYNRLMAAQQSLNALDDLRRRRKDYAEKRAAAAEQHAIYEELRTAFGRNGVPAMIIETAIPELEAIANDLLSRMTNGRMAVRFSTQREKVTGGSMETLDIAIADELGTRSYELYSGGEAFRINFAIRVALSKLLARRAGAHLETLFIDEGFGTQDEEGRSRLVEAINAVKDDFALILVITHIDELKDAFPVHIAVEKTADGSTIAVK